MAKLVDAVWVAERIDSHEIILVDPRRPMKYLSGHLPGAVNLPTYQAFGADGKLLPTADLADFIGKHGVGGAAIPVLYDSPDGQTAAMLAWTLEYLGRTDVLVLDCFYEHWKQRGLEVRYKPVPPKPVTFVVRENPAVRATLTQVRDLVGLKLLDLRSPEEFSGDRAMGEDTPGHIPGAINLVWRDFAGPPERLLAPYAQIEQMLISAGVRRDDRIIAYCRSGLRASLGYLALKELGYDVRLFDGSYAEWSRNGLPAEK
jgi:thiosulfate/3-mercaptopyruvate sulfurtransferase